MRLRDVLVPAHVAVPLQARTVREATHRLAEQLIQAGAVADQEKLLAVIDQAWPEDMVSVGEHAFLPHFRTDAATQLIAALGVAPNPIAWEKDPNRTARVVILVIAPPKEAASYLQLVGALARALSDHETVDGLLSAKTAADVVAVAGLETMELTGDLTVRDVMTEHVLTIDPERTLGEAAHLMLEHDIRALPVVNEGGALVGIVTHKELLKFLIPDYVARAKTGAFRAPTRNQILKGTSDPRQILVKEAMARTVLCVSHDQRLSDVANLMNNKDVDRFPVVREGAVVGFLTRADMIRRLLTP
ncbi:MAG TPA: CBS domain-containing protein [Gemmatimonadales bacterium]|nr:CBS domain-containing protein [Gemmatimonadales bacterium]